MEPYEGGCITWPVHPMVAANYLAMLTGEAPRMLVAARGHGRMSAATEGAMRGVSAGIAGLDIAVRGAPSSVATEGAMRGVSAGIAGLDIAVRGAPSSVATEGAP